jgi:hypothetical protein
MIFVYRPKNSTSARLLSTAVDGVRIKHEENLRRRAKASDKIIMWGAYLPNITGITLNNVPLQTKFEDAIRLREAGVLTVEVSRTRPVVAQATAPVDPLIALWQTAQEAAEAFTNLEPARHAVALAGIDELRAMLGRVRMAQIIPAPVAPPAQPDGQWLARKNNHVGGNDLLNPDERADYFSKWEQFVREYRVHSFFGRSIRAGQKVHRTPQSETPFHGTPHPWIRSFDGGWMISYADGALGERPQRIRDIAHDAVRALGLNFGAVDIGERADGTLVVLEVNRAPGVEGGTTEAYARAARRWIAGEWTPDNAE